MMAVCPRRLGDCSRRTYAYTYSLLPELHRVQFIDYPLIIRYSRLGLLCLTFLLYHTGTVPAITQGITTACSQEKNTQTSNYGNRSLCSFAGHIFPGHGTVLFYGILRLQRLCAVRFDHVHSIRNRSKSHARFSDQLFISTDCHQKCQSHSAEALPVYHSHSWRVLRLW